MSSSEPITNNNLFAYSNGINIYPYEITYDGEQCYILILTSKTGANLLNYLNNGNCNYYNCALDSIINKSADITINNLKIGSKITTILVGSGGGGGSGSHVQYSSTTAQYDGYCGAPGGGGTCGVSIFNELTSVYNGDDGSVDKLSYYGFAILGVGGSGGQCSVGDNDGFYPGLNGYPGGSLYVTGGDLPIAPQSSSENYLNNQLIFYEHSQVNFQAYWSMSESGYGGYGSTSSGNTQAGLCTAPCNQLASDVIACDPTYFTYDESTCKIACYSTSSSLCGGAGSYPIQLGTNTYTVPSNYQSTCAIGNAPSFVLETTNNSAPYYTRFSAGGSGGNCTCGFLSPQGSVDCDVSIAHTQGGLPSDSPSIYTTGYNININTKTSFATIGGGGGIVSPTNISTLYSFGGVDGVMSNPIFNFSTSNKSGAINSYFADSYNPSQYFDNMTYELSETFEGWGGLGGMNSGTLDEFSDTVTPQYIFNNTTAVGGSDAQLNPGNDPNILNIYCDGLGSGGGGGSGDAISYANNKNYINDYSDSGITSPLQYTSENIGNWGGNGNEGCIIIIISMSSFST